MEYLKSKHLRDSGSEDPPTKYCCYLHMMAGHIVPPSDFYYRCFYHYDGHTGTATGIPTYEIFMLCQKLLFLSLEAVGLGILVDTALDHDCAVIETFYKFTNYRLNLKVLSAIEEVVSAKLNRLEKHRGLDDSYSPSSKKIPLEYYGPEFSGNQDLKMWTSFKAVSRALLAVYKHHSLLDYYNIHKDLNFISQLTAFAGDLSIPKSYDGAHVMPELDTIAMIILHKQQRDATVHQQCLCEPNNLKLHANTSYIEDYHFTRFFMDAGVVDPACPERMGMLVRLNAFIKLNAAFKMSMATRKGNATMLATGCSHDELSDNDNKDCLWIHKFTEYYHAGSVIPPQQLVRLNRMTEALGMSVIDLAAPHASPVCQHEIKNAVSLLDGYQPNMSNESVYEVHRALDSLGYIAHSSRRSMDPTHVKAELLRVLAGLMKESSAQGDWFTFGLAVLPYALHHCTAAGTVTATAANNADRNAVLDLLADCVISSGNDFAICQACSALALFFQSDSSVKKVLKRGLLEGVMALLKQQESSDNVVAQLCLILPPLFKPAFSGVLDESTAKRYMIILHVTLTALLSNKRSFATLRYQIRPHELAINGFVCPGEASIAQAHTMHGCRKADQTRSRAIVSLYNILQYTFNISLHTNSTFFQMGAVRLMHLGMKEKDKRIILAALRACAVLLRDATVPYQHSAVKLPGFIGDVSRIFCKYKVEVMEEPALDIMSSVCSPSTGMVEREVWCRWIDDSHSYSRLIPKLVHHALLKQKTLTLPTYSMATLVFISLHSNQETFDMLKQLDILAICQRNMSNTVRMHGHCQTQRLVTHCMRTMLGMLCREPNLLEKQAVQDLFPLLLTYVGSPYPPVKGPFKRLNPIWRGNNCTSFRDCPGAPLTDEELDKMQRLELFSSALSVVDYICTLDTHPADYYADQFVESGFVECFERVLLKASVNCGGQQLVKKTRVLDNVDTFNQYGWSDVMRVCKTLRNIAGKETGDVLVNRFFARPGPMNALHNLILLAYEQAIPWKQLVVLVDTVQVLITVAFVPHKEKSVRPGSTKSALLQMFESRQNMFRNKWKGQMLLDTLFDLYTATSGKLENETFGRFLILLRTCIAEDYRVAAIVETTETYQHLQLGKSLPIITNEMMECQLAVAHKKPGCKPWQPVHEKVSESVLRKLAIRTTRQQDILAKSDALINLEISPEEQRAAAATDAEIVHQEIRQKVLGRLTPDRGIKLQQICLRDNHTTIFELAEVRVMFQEEMARHVKPPTMYETMVENLRHFDLPTKAVDSDSALSAIANSRASHPSNASHVKALATAATATAIASASASASATVATATTSDDVTSTVASVNAGDGTSAEANADASSVQGTTLSADDASHVTQDVRPAEKERTMKSHKSNTCDFCGKEMEKARKCARCRKAYYCSRECQRSAWKAHRPACE